MSADVIGPFMPGSADAIEAPRSQPDRLRRFEVLLADPSSPVLLGEGVRLFERTGSKHVELEKTRVIDSPRSHTSDTVP